MPRSKNKRDFLAAHFGGGGPSKRARKQNAKKKKKKTTLLAASHWGPWPVRCIKTAAQGRSLVAEEDLVPGDVVLRVRPTADCAVPLDSALCDCCSICLAETDHGAAYGLCAACGADPWCKAVHDGECGAVAAAVELAANDGNNDESATVLVRQLLRLMVVQKLATGSGSILDEAAGADTAGTPTPGAALVDSWHAIAELEEHLGEMPTDRADELRRTAMQALRLLHLHGMDARAVAASGDAARVEHWAAVAAKLECNEIAVARSWVWPWQQNEKARGRGRGRKSGNGARRSMAALGLGKDTVGIGLFTSASMLNHSCSPNCFVSLTNPNNAAGRGVLELVVRAVKHVKRGQHLSIGYTSLYQPAAHRQRELQGTYFFSCRCARCEAAMGMGMGPEDESEAEDEVAVSSEGLATEQDIDDQMQGFRCACGGLLVAEGEDGDDEGQESALELTCLSCEQQTRDVSAHRGACARLMSAQTTLMANFRALGGEGEKTEKEKEGSKVKAKALDACVKASRRDLASLDAAEDDGDGFGSESSEAARLLHPLHVLHHTMRVLQLGLAVLADDSAAVRLGAIRALVRLGEAASAHWEPERWTAFLILLLFRFREKQAAPTTEEDAVEVRQALGTLAIYYGPVFANSVAVDLKLSSEFVRSGPWAW